MDDFNRLLEKLEAYKKLDDIANRRNIIDLLISEYPDHIESWYEKARLLTGNFKENMVASQVFLKCMSNIEKLGGKDNEYYKECAVFYEKVLEIEKEKNKKIEEQARLDKEKERQKEEEKKRLIIKGIIKVLIAVAIITTIWGVFFPLFTRTTFSSVEKMKFKISGTYYKDDVSINIKDTTYEYYRKLVISNGTVTRYSCKDNVETKEWDETIVKYNPQRGYFKTGPFKYIVDKDGNIVSDGNVFIKVKGSR